MAFLKHIQVAESSMAGRAYMGEVLTQVWLKSIKKWVSYLIKKWMHKKEF